MLDRSCVGRISNFGIAKPAIDTGGVTATNFNTLDVVGTLGYMSPESLRGLSPKVDTFAFGLVVLEVFSGYSINNPAPGYKNLLLCLKTNLTRLISFAAPCLNC